MKSNAKTDNEDCEEQERPTSPYDQGAEEDDLWFLPDPDDELDDFAMPLPQGERTPLVRPADWVDAQGVNADQLARTAMAVGQLDMMVAQVQPQGQMQNGVLARLALREAEALSWAAGMPVSLEEIGRDQVWARANTNPNALRQARWAARRLMGDGDARDLRSFLGLHRTEVSDLPVGLSSRVSGTMFDDEAGEFLKRVDRLSDVHGFVRAAYARYLWQLSDLSQDDNRIEAQVWASRLMSDGCLALTFVPFGQGVRSLQGSGPDDLGVYLRAAETGAIAARFELQGLLSWHRRALAVSASIKGKNPARVVAALVAKPMATTEMIEQAAGVSRDTAERLLVRLADLDLVREVTGANRFRIWTAKA